MNALERYRNCRECGQARHVDALDENGVCLRCRLPIIQWPHNPLIPTRP